MQMEIKIKNNVVNIYRDNSKDSLVGETYKGYTMNVTEVSADGQFYYIPAYEGWIEASNMTIVNTSGSTISDDAIVATVTEQTTNLFANEEVVSTEGQSNDSDLSKVAASDILGIFAMPYQFMPTVDRRLKKASNNGIGDGVGRKYADKILARGNLLYLTPGVQDFLVGASQSEKDGLLNSLIDTAGSGMGSLDPNSIVRGQRRYYSLEFKWDEYFRYVDIACAATAELLDIGNEYISIGNQNNRKIKDIHWSGAMSSQYNTGIFGINQNLVFYTDGLNQISEGFSNSTRESSLVSQINGYSDTVKEINYIMNIGPDSGRMDMFQDENFASTMSGIQNTVKNFTSGTGVLGAILGNSTTVLSGGKLVFPELWSDSDYDRSYSIDIKLRSPDSDTVSIFLNIIVPYIHLMALTAPRDFDAASNGYVAPFLVRAYFKSLFNIDMGIITDLSVTKGGEGNWAATTNLPTSLDVSITIKDLYKSMFMSRSKGLTDYAKLVSNDAEMEQLMTLAGLNTQEFQDPQNKLDLYTALVSNKVKNVFPRIGDSIRTDFANALARIF